jgi:hypothetical protein
MMRRLANAMQWNRVAGHHNTSELVIFVLANSEAFVKVAGL